MATLAQTETRERSFWQKITLGLAIFIVFGFAQFAARGFVDYGAAPVYVHLHGMVMMAWLALMVVQPTLVQRGNAALHRRLGWTGAVLAVLVVGMGSFIGIRSLQNGTQPPFFTQPYFLALTQTGVITFAGLVGFAIARRRQTEWHRRLLVGAMVALMEPALGRVLPMPFIMPWGEWLALAIQLGVMGLIMRHDRKTLGAIHPATLIAALVITLHHIIVETLAITPAWQAFAEHVVAG
jgi:hypothetical protein